LIIDAKGNLYGTTEAGGVGRIKGGGTVYEFAPGGRETVLYAFRESGYLGQEPDGLVMDRKGHLFGTTGTGHGSPCGTAYKILAVQTKKTRYKFAGPPNDGCGAQGSLVIDANGNLFGTTSSGGKRDEGIAFEIAKDGTETVLHSFCAKTVTCADGASPLGGLIMDKSGNLIGTTESGGNHLCTYGCGTVFELTPDGTESVLHAFKGSPNDGWEPVSKLIQGPSGNFYGTTAGGGVMSDRCVINMGCGIVFKLAPNGDETVRYYFKGRGGGYSPYGGLIEDAAGNLYGTTSYGGSYTYPCGGGCGTVFEIAPDGTETILYRFKHQGDGEFPVAGLVADASGNLYGTAGGGRTGYGTLFEITP
jgi:uncharacterized repeat protein (TIGR03803 family)